MKKIIFLALALTSSMSTIASASERLDLECYADVKCPVGSCCALRGLSLNFQFDSKELAADDVQARAYTNLSSKSGSVLDQKVTSRHIKLVGKDAFGESFSARIRFELLDQVSTTDYSTVGKYNLFRLYPVDLKCKKL